MANHKMSCITRRLYVTNIQPDIKDKQIRDIFGEIGKVVGCKIVPDPSTLEYKAAFVTFRNKSSVLTALEHQESLIVRGEHWYLNIAPPKKHQLFVGGYDLHVTKKQLISFFSYYGEVENVNMKYDAQGHSRCFGFVTFKDSPDAVKSFVRKRFVECLGKIVEIKWAVPGGRNQHAGFPSQRPSARLHGERVRSSENIRTSDRARAEGRKSGFASIASKKPLASFVQKTKQEQVTSSPEDNKSEPTPTSVTSTNSTPDSESSSEALNIACEKILSRAAGNKAYEKEQSLYGNLAQFQY